MATWTLTPELVIAVVAGAAGLVTAIWHAAMYVGKLTVRVQRHEDRLDDHDAQFKDLRAGRIRY